jgi:hypothetical protein
MIVDHCVNSFSTFHTLSDDRSPDYRLGLSQMVIIHREDVEPCGFHKGILWNRLVTSLLIGTTIRNALSQGSGEEPEIM